jgi:ABC-2 type transport system permease protein
MRNMLLIAKREYLEQVRGRAFRLTTILVPAAFALVFGVFYIANMGIGSQRHIVVAAPTAALAQDIRARMLDEKGTKPVVDVVAPATPADRAALVGEVADREIDAVVWVQATQGAVPTTTYLSRSSGDFMTVGHLTDEVNSALVDQHLVGSGMAVGDADALVKGVTIDTYQVKKDGQEVKSNAMASFWKGYAMAILLSMTTMIYGMNVARSIIQEKTSRIFEVMLSTAEPRDLLSGKLIGVGAVGLTQITIWLVCGAAILASPLAAAAMSGEFDIHFSLAEVVLFPVYYLLGYLLYSSLFAGLAATCETEQELQMYMPLAAMPTWLSFAMIVLIMNDSNSVWSVAASLFPPTAPIVMFLRMASQIPPAWQFAVSIGLMILSIWAVLWMSSRLYRVGILMYGKRATLPELLRWLRYS